MSGRAVKMCVVTAQASTAEVLYRGQLEYLTEHGFEITVVCSPTDRPESITERGVGFHPIEMPRKITPWRDLSAVSRLTDFLRRGKFDMVQACTPKGSLVGVTAARRANIPLVIHLLRGLAYQRQGRFRAWLLRMAARKPCQLAHHVISVGHDLRQLAIDDGLCPPEKITVLGYGSSNGVDIDRFSPVKRNARGAERDRLGIPHDAVVIGFVGRLTNDKGIRELLHAFRKLRDARPQTRLLVVGSYEHRDRPPAEIADVIASDEHIHHVEWSRDVVPLYGAMDLVALPTYREGFNNVILEAAAMGLPVISSDTVGCREGVLHNESGLLVPVGDADALAAALQRLSVDVDLRSRFGTSGRRHVESHFDRRTIWPRYVEFYRQQFQKHCPDLAKTLSF